MRYLVALVFILLAGCEDYTGNAIRNMECRWIHKYEICICISTSGYRGYMAAVPDRVCNRIIMPPAEIEGSIYSDTL
jgi:hypothetical protein